MVNEPDGIVQNFAGRLFVEPFHGAFSFCAAPHVLVLKEIIDRDTCIALGGQFH